MNVDYKDVFKVCFVMLTVLAPMSADGTQTPILTEVPCLAATRPDVMLVHGPSLTAMWVLDLAYGAILVGAIVLPAKPVDALFALAAGVVLLIIIGIRNAWDVVTFIAIKGPDKPSS